MHNNGGFNSNYTQSCDMKEYWNNKSLSLETTPPAVTSQITILAHYFPLFCDVRHERTADGPSVPSHVKWASSGSVAWWGATRDGAAFCASCTMRTMMTMIMRKKGVIKSASFRNEAIHVKDYSGHNSSNPTLNYNGNAQSLSRDSAPVRCASWLDAPLRGWDDQLTGCLNHIFSRYVLWWINKVKGCF